jgi:alpha-galactosidase
MQVIKAVAAGMEFTFALTAEEGDLALTCTVEPVAAPNAYLIRFRAQRSNGQPFTAHILTIHWDAPLVDVHGVFAASPSPLDLVSLPFWEVKRRTAANVGVPFVSLFHRNGENRYAFGLLDQLTETDLSFTLSEATRCYHFHWRKPELETGALTCCWEEILFVSFSRRPWPEVLDAYRQAVDHEWPQPRLPVPASAYDPVFCSWTAIHHDVNQEWVVRTARLAAELGFGVWLTDDGWFTDKARFADYRYTGDWQPCNEKFPDFAGHVRTVQEMGMRYVLWVGPFMIGDESWASDRHAHLLMDRDERLHYSRLSPWRRETAAVIGELLERLVVDYRLDGLKLDFIDAIQRMAQRPADADYPTLGAGLYDILCRAVERVAALRPELLIELRNRYTNLAGRRYGNLYRASDVPINFAWNRWQATMLRLLAPDRAVQLDPALWHPDDTDENVAVHLINVICSVPIISVDLERYPPSHKDLIRAWIGFYNAHRQTIIHGRFQPIFRQGHVSLIHFVGVDERIIGLYDDIAFAPELGSSPTWILNASTRSVINLLPDGVKDEFIVVRRNKFGREEARELVRFPVQRLIAEVGGSLEIRPVDKA